MEEPVWRYCSHILSNPEACMPVICAQVYTCTCMCACRLKHVHLQVCSQDHSTPDPNGGEPVRAPPADHSGGLGGALGV